MNQFFQGGVLMSHIGCHPVISHEIPHVNNGCIDERREGPGDCVKTDSIHFLLPLQDNTDVGVGKECGQHGDDEDGQDNDRQQHADLE
jgi:hypothetical protein